MASWLRRNRAIKHHAASSQEVNKNRQRRGLTLEVLEPRDLLAGHVAAHLAVHAAKHHLVAKLAVAEARHAAVEVGHSVKATVAAAIEGVRETKAEISDYSILAAAKLSIASLKHSLLGGGSYSSTNGNSSSPGSPIANTVLSSIESIKDIWSDPDGGDPASRVESTLDYVFSNLVPNGQSAKSKVDSVLARFTGGHGSDNELESRPRGLSIIEAIKSRFHGDSSNGDNYDDYEENSNNPSSQSSHGAGLLAFLAHRTGPLKVLRGLLESGGYQSNTPNSNGSYGNGSSVEELLSNLSVRGKTYNVTVFDENTPGGRPDVYTFHTDGTITANDGVSGFYTANPQKFTLFLTGSFGTVGFTGLSDIKGTTFQATGTATFSGGSTIPVNIVGQQLTS